MKTATLASVVFLSTLSQTPAYAQDISVGVGIGSRDISALEGTVEEYLDKRGYGEQLPGLDDAIDFDGTTIPYILLTGMYTPRKPILPMGTTEHLVELDWTSSLFGVEKDEQTLDLKYEGLDLGEGDVSWSYKINTYLSLGAGTHYTPLIIHHGKSNIRLGFILQGGISYVNGVANLGLSLANNKLYEAMDPVMVEESYGIAEHSTVNAKFSGLGYFFHPTAAFSVDLGKRLTLEMDWGYRPEYIPVDVTETVTSADTTVEKTRGNLNLSGKTTNLKVEYHF